MATLIESLERLVKKTARGEDNGEIPHDGLSSQDREPWGEDLTEEQIRATTFVYNRQARVYAETMEWSDTWDQSMLGGESRRGAFFYFLDLLGGTPHTIVDVGCGTGRAASILSKMGHIVVAIDNAPGMIEEGRQRAADSGILFIVADLRTEFPSVIGSMDLSGEIDGIMCNSALTHIPKTEIEGVLNNFYNALRPGGSLFFGLKTTPDGSVFMDEKIGLPRYFTTYSPGELQAVRHILDEIGFNLLTDFSFPHSLPDKPDWRDFYIRKPINAFVQGE